MSDSDKKPRFKIGDKVRVTDGTRLLGLISEVHFVPQGSGRISYRVRIEMDPEPLWMELPESSVEAA